MIIAHLRSTKRNKFFFNHAKDSDGMTFAGACRYGLMNALRQAWHVPFNASEIWITWHTRATPDCHAVSLRRSHFSGVCELRTRCGDREVVIEDGSRVTPWFLRDGTYYLEVWYK